MSLLGYVAPSPGSEMASAVEPMSKAMIIAKMGEISREIQSLLCSDLNNPRVLKRIGELEKAYQKLSRMLQDMDARHE